jgi:hypothetical protein
LSPPLLAVFLTAGGGGGGCGGGEEVLRSLLRIACNSAEDMAVDAPRRRRQRGCRHRHQAHAAAAARVREPVRADGRGLPKYERLCAGPSHRESYACAQGETRNALAERQGRRARAGVAAHL